MDVRRRSNVPQTGAKMLQLFSFAIFITVSELPRQAYLDGALTLVWQKNVRQRNARPLQLLMVDASNVFNQSSAIFAPEV